MGKVEELILSLYDVGAVKFGSFTLKSGIQSPIYFDLRVIISHPKLMHQISEILEEVVSKQKNVDVICGVPYTALPLATILSVRRDIPMVIKRKEQKKYGTGKLIEGEYTPGKTKCLILEDVVTTGSSIAETTSALRDHGIIVEDAVVVLNRNYPRADENLKRSGVNLTSIVKVDELLKVLLEASRITSAQKVEVEAFLQNGQTIPEDVKGKDKNGVEVGRKGGILDNLRGKAGKLMEIVIKKESNLCLSADCENWREVLEVTEALGGKICGVKTHIDAINFGGVEEINEFTERIKGLAREHNFVVIEDRKFADIGSTVEKQLSSKPFSICEWAEYVTVHSIPGPGMLKVFEEKDVGVILIAEMSSTGNLPALLPDYKEKTLEMCGGFEETCVGFVSQSRVGPSLRTVQEQGKSTAYLQFTPGVSLNAKGDSLGQQYVTVEEAVLQRDADIVIVGRGIIKQEKEKWVEVAEQYRSQGWEALKKKLNI